MPMPCARHEQTYHTCKLRTAGEVLHTYMFHTRFISLICLGQRHSDIEYFLIEIGAQKARGPSMQLQRWIRSKAHGDEHKSSPVASNGLFKWNCTPRDTRNFTNFNRRLESGPPPYQTTSHVKNIKLLRALSHKVEIAEDTREALRRSRVPGTSGSALTPAVMSIPTWDMQTPMCVLPGDSKHDWILSPAADGTLDGEGRQKNHTSRLFCLSR